jgi:hypothetical protein
MELQCSEQLDEKLIVMTLDGCHGELQSNILATELYKNLTEEGCRFVGMYDSKNAKLCERYAGKLSMLASPS